MSPVPCGLSPVDTILVLKFEWGQRGQAVLRFEWKSGWDQTGKLELASTLTFGFVNPAGTEPDESVSHFINEQNSQELQISLKD